MLLLVCMDTKLAGLHCGYVVIIKSPACSIVHEHAHVSALYAHTVWFCLLRLTCTWFLVFEGIRSSVALMLTCVWKGKDSMKVTVMSACASVMDTDGTFCVSFVASYTRRSSHTKKPASGKGCHRDNYCPVLGSSADAWSAWHKKHSDIRT